MQTRFNAKVSEHVSRRLCLLQARFAKSKHAKYAPHRKLQSLRSRNRSHALNSKPATKHTVEQAFDVYRNLDTQQKDEYIVDAMLTILIENNRQDKILEISDDVVRLKNTSSLLLLIKCCKEIMHKHPTTTLQILHQIEQCLPECGDNHIRIQTALLGIYSDINIENSLHSAWRIFDAIDAAQMDVFCIGVMMKCLVDHREYTQAIELYQRHNAHIAHNDTSKTLYIKACTQLGGEYHHKCDEFIKSEILRSPETKFEPEIIDAYNIRLWNTLIDFYGKSGDIETAKLLFHRIANHKKTVVTMNSMMNALMNNHENDTAIALFDEFVLSGSMRAQDLTYTLYIGACLNVGRHDKIQRIVRRFTGMHKHSVQLITGFMNYYGKTHDIESAEKLFNDLAPHKRNDIGVVNSLMNIYRLNEQYSKCFELWQRCRDHTKSDHITYGILLHCCIETTSLYIGQRIHDELKADVSKRGILRNCVAVQIPLITMYGKCGKLDICEQLFAELKQNEHEKYLTEIGVWNAMINAFARNGKSEIAMKLFDRMRVETKLKPNYKTYTILLNCCGHCGELELAKRIFAGIEDETVKNDIGLFTAFVDCLSRKGCLQNAYALIVEYETRNEGVDTQSLWNTLLGACRKHSDEAMANRVYSKLT